MMEYKRIMEEIKWLKARKPGIESSRVFKKDFDNGVI